MEPLDISQWLRRSPFVPFRMTLSNGKKVDVRHPELAIVSRTTVTVGTMETDADPPIADEVEFVALMHVNHIEAIPQYRQ